MKLAASLSEVYWNCDHYAIDDPRRMAMVMYELAQLIRTWAPPEEQARICHLAINEVADRLIRETTIPETASAHPD
jgi:hypothetical protein